MTAIALFGGSFNPPHVAHQLVALYVLETQPIDELWLVPAYAHPFGKSLAPYEQRVAMCELAAAPLGARVRVSRAEQELAERPGFVASRTLDLIEHLERPGVQLRLVVGSDILGETAQWHRWDEVARRAAPIVVSRPGFPGGTGVAASPGSAGARSTAEQCAVSFDVSSTRVRELLAARDPSVSALVPRAVLSYIAGHGLYDRA